MFDRKAILVALSLCKGLTPEMVRLVRLGNEDVVRRELWKAGACDGALAAAGIPISKSGERPDDAKIQEMVNLNCYALGLEPWEIEWADPRLADKLDLVLDWERPLAGINVGWAMMVGIPGRVARILALADVPAWQPLVWLIENGVWTFGPSVTRGTFIIQDPAAPWHD